MTATFIATVAFLLSLLFPQGVVRIPGPGGHALSAGGNTFTKVTAANFSCSATPCTVTHTFTPGNAVQILFGDFQPTAFITAISGAGTWTIPSGCQVSDSTAGSMSCAYILSNTGATSISITYGGAAAVANGTYFEYSVSPGPASLDQVSAVDRSSSSSTQTMISPTLTGSSDAIAQGIEVNSGQTVSGFTTAYTVAQAGGDYGSVYILNSTLATAPVANLGASQPAAVNEIAFK